LRGLLLREKRGGEEKGKGGEGRGKGREGKENGDRSPNIFGLKVAQTGRPWGPPPAKSY